MRRIFVKTLSAFMALAMISTFAVACTDSGGDGKKSCKVCGKKQVYALGYCERCYDNFCDFTYGDD